MVSQKANRATAKGGLLEGMNPAECLSTLGDVCAIGAQSPEVQSSPAAMHTLNALQQAVSAANTALKNKEALAQALMAAINELNVDMGAVKIALNAYQALVIVIADGDASVINKAGLPSRAQSPKAPAAVGDVVGLSFREGKNNGEAIVSWPKVVGATAYAIEVNMTPENPNGPWTALPSGGGRKRVVQTPARGAQVLVRVAAIGNRNKQSAWSNPILVTTR